MNGSTNGAMNGADIRLPNERMALLFMVMLVSAAGNTAMQSVMPSIGTRLGIADVWVSLAYSWSALLWVVMAPYWARRSDRRGRKAMMALGIAGFVISFALCAVILRIGLSGWISGVLTMVLFALARSFYGGFGSAAPPAVQAYVASRTGRADRTKALSLVASSFGLGTVVGPALAPLMILPGLGVVGPFAIFAALGLIVLVLVRTRLPDDDPRFSGRGEVMSAPFSASSNPRIVDETPDGSPDELPEAEPAHTGVDRVRWTDKRLRKWLIAGVVGGHSQAMLLGVIGFLLMDRLGLRGDPDAAAGPIGLVLMAGAFATLLAQWGLIPMLGLGPRTSTIWGMALGALGIVPVAMGTDLHSIAVGFAVASLGFGMFRPGFTSGASLAVTRAEQGQAAGIITSVNGAAYVAAPAIGVWLYSHSQWLAWGTMEALAVVVVIIGVFALEKDSA
ncbi:MULTISPECIES: MFS transporter [unclassified Novosphingobium]|uniref:MFS transporter n=1 Tax=unclassified Novosphingobium TaxID=2644732 RepID=UPI0025D7FDEB|nr:MULTISPECIES: MFS transporter [unclassified Novosphingobium]